MYRPASITFVFTFILTVSFSQHQKVVTWYDNNKAIPKEIYFVLKKNPDVLDSTFTSFYQNGKIKFKGNYSRNKTIGVWEYYYENGKLKAKGEMQDNNPVNFWQYFYENGGLNMEGNIDKGLKEGEWKLYYENGNLKSSGKYVKGKKEGAWSYFYEDGKFKAQAKFVNDKGVYTEYYPDGGIKSEGTIEQGKSNGKWKYFYEDGILKAEGEEKDGLKEGYWKFYHPNGKIASEGNYVKGKEEGKWKYYHDNGQVSAEGDNKEGNRDGYWKLYYNNGVFKAEGNFKKGDGEYKEYYESGKIKIRGNIKQGKNDGEWTYYYESGKVEGKCFFVEGGGNYKGYYENGNLKMEGRIEDGHKVGIWKLYNEDGTLAGYYKTYYENETPVFVPMTKEKPLTKVDSVKPVEKPELVLPKKRSIHYTKKVNEYRDFIISFHPLGIFKNQIPFSVEYYYQERLGYELNYTVHRSPLLKSAASLPMNAVYKRGFSAYFRQKLYSKDQDNGMFYWAQEFRFTSMDWYVNTTDTTGENVLLHSKERAYEFSVLFGDRLLKDARKKGWTLDLFAGLGIGYRTVDKNYSSDPGKDALFLGLKTRNLSVPLRLGLSVGYLF